MSKNRYMKTIAAMNKILVYCHEHYNECDSKGQSELAEVNQAAKDALELLKEYKRKEECPCTHCMEWECNEVCEEYKKWKDA